MQPPELSIIIVTWNVRDRLRACLASVAAAEPGQGALAAVETIVVDSASSDGTAGMVSAEFPDVQLIASAENLGYTRGNNLGLRRSLGRYAFVLNPDTEVAPAALASMLDYMEAHPRVGVLGPKLVLPDDTVQSTRRRFPNLVTALFESTWLQPFAPRRLLAAYYAADLPLDRPVQVDWLVGAALADRLFSRGSSAAFRGAVQRAGAGGHPYPF